MQHERLIVLDFGSQVTQLIARRIRELGVYAEILPFDTPIQTLREHAPKGIIFSGGPKSLRDEGAPRIDKAIVEMGVPVLGICYGMYILVDALGGSVRPAEEHEYGHAKMRVLGAQGPLQGFAINEELAVWMSHADQVEQLPEGFVTLGRSEHCPHAAIADDARGFWAMQYHPEVSHTKQGTQMLDRFVQRCGFARDWSVGSWVDESVEAIREQVGESGRVICGLSGGVDSSVAAMLVERAIGDRLHCIFVDNGLLRLNEREQVEAMFADKLKNPLVVADARAEFLDALSGVTDPEQKRKIIGKTFIDVFDAKAHELGGADYLVQGTLYPDVIESVSARGPSATIKTHHNVGGLPEHMKMKVVEPLRELFKDEVRKLGEHLGLSEEMVWRHPFPGPGLAVRVLGEVTQERCDRLRKADAIIIEEIRRAGLYREIWQAFGVLLPVRSVGVMGDGRSYENALAIRAVESLDAMTADWCHLPYELLGRMSNRIINEVRGINRVCYDISSKPPATIEWE